MNAQCMQTIDVYIGLFSWAKTLTTLCVCAVWFLVVVFLVILCLWIVCSRPPLISTLNVHCHVLYTVESAV